MDSAELDARIGPMWADLGLDLSLAKINTELSRKTLVYGAYAEAGCDIVWMGDDLGTQESRVSRDV